jgi:GT2 family glycosyltransferase
VSAVLVGAAGLSADPAIALDGSAHTGVTGLEGSSLVVLGMHRSGTSALAGTLRHLGVELGDCLMEASPDNPRGYWEHRDIVAVNDKLLTELGRAWDDIRPLPASWEKGEATAGAGQQLLAILVRDFAKSRLWGLKDPRLCRLLPLWIPMLDQLQVKPRFLLALRHPRDVAASLAARDGVTAARAGLLWLRHVLDAERATRGHLRIILHYEDLVGPRGWRSLVSRISDKFDLVWPEAGPSVESVIDAYLSPELRHHRAGKLVHTDQVEDYPGFWIEAVYSAFVCADESGLRKICDVVGRELDNAGQVFLPIIDEAEHDLAKFRIELHSRDRAVAELNERLTQTAREITELRAAFAQKRAEKLQMRATPAVALDGAGLPQPLAVMDAYPQWITSRASTAVARSEWVAERVSEWTSVPKLALGTILPAGTEARVALTLRSLLLQVAGDWELHVVAEHNMPAALATEPRVFWHQDEDRAAGTLNRCLAESNADWVALIDAGDQLAPHALFGIADAFIRHPEWSAVYSDEDRIDLQDVRSAPHFKPDFNLDLLRSLPYVGGLLAVRHEFFVEIGGFNPRWEGIEEYDLALRLAERAGARGFGHIADVLYHRLTISGRSKRAIEAICADMPCVVQAHLDRLGIDATAEPGQQSSFCCVRYRHEGPEPLVSIIVPTKNQLKFLKRCVESVLQRTVYQNYELIVVDNGSTDADACDYLQRIEDKFDEIGSRIRVLRHPGAFNFSAMNNRAVREAARGEYICLLNNDAAPLDGVWLGEMMSLARRADIGAVGAKLLYPDGRVQHAGVILGVGWGSPADHPFNGEPESVFGYWGRLQVVQDFSAVTAACMVTRRSVYDEVGGLDEETFAVAYNDVDYCLKVREAGYLVTWTPLARLLHETSASIRADVEGKAVQEKIARFARERMAMYQRWMPRIAFDPAYNRNLSSQGWGFAAETEGPPTWDPEFRPRQRVLVHPADREGCGEYRIIAPSRALLKSGLVHCHETMRLFTPPEVARMAPDSIVFQRQLDWQQIEVIERVKNTSTAFRVFELDDLITNLPLKSVHRKAMPPDMQERLKRALSLCDRLVVSTEPLECQYGKLCGDTAVLPNRLEKRRWLGLAPKRRFDGKPRVGWAGALGHLGDLTLIESVVEATARDINWVFFGMCPDELRRFVAEYHEWVPLHDYAKKLASLDLDLAIAPLELNAFNEAKSNLRLLEYGVLGYPVLCTDILPYQGDLPVFRVANRHHAWTKALREITADRDECRRAGERVRAAVLKDWMLEDNLDEWQRAWLR